MFVNIYLEIESMVTKEIDSNLSEIGLEKGLYSTHSIVIDFIDSEVEISGFDKLKGEEFCIFYDYRKKEGRIHYLDNHIEWF